MALKRGDTEFNINGGKRMQIWNNNPLVPYKHELVGLTREFLTDFVRRSSPRTKGVVIISVGGCITAVACTAIKHYSKPIAENGCTIKFKDLEIVIKGRNQPKQSAKTKQVQKH